MAYVIGREKLLAGLGTAEEASKMFGLSASFIYKIRQGVEKVPEWMTAELLRSITKKRTEMVIECQELLEKAMDHRDGKGIQRMMPHNFREAFPKKEIRRIFNGLKDWDMRGNKDTVPVWMTKEVIAKVVDVKWRHVEEIKEDVKEARCVFFCK